MLILYMIAMCVSIGKLMDMSSLLGIKYSFYSNCIFRDLFSYKAFYRFTNTSKSTVGLYKDEAS
jgi:hypothetical protein